MNMPPCLIGIEAGMASHHVARELAALGHEAKRVPPAYSKPFRQGHKNDFRDAHAVDRTILGRITKRGNRYLRMLFIQGARAILLHPASWVKHSFGSWLAIAARRLRRARWSRSRQ